MENTFEFYVKAIFCVNTFQLHHFPIVCVHSLKYNHFMEVSEVTSFKAAYDKVFIQGPFIILPLYTCEIPVGF